MKGLTFQTALTPSRHRRRRAMTLVELVVSMAIMTVIMAGTASVMLIASSALPDAQNPGRAVTDSGDLVGQIAGELAYATSVTEESAVAVTFTVADRGHGASGEETIRYAWSGKSGDVLTRQYNGGSVVTVAEDVYEFDLSYVMEVVTTQGDAVTNESAEMLLVSQDTSANPKNFALTDKLWIGQYFHPYLAADVVAWRVTRVKFQARQSGSAMGITAVQLRLPAGNLPDAAVIEEVYMYESSLGSSYRWEEFSFANVAGLSPTQGLCLVLALKKKDKQLAGILYDDSSGSARLTTGDGGNKWNYDSGRSMPHYVYGTVTNSTLPDAVTRQWLLSAEIKLRLGPDPSTHVETEVQVLNVPEVIVP